MKGKNMQNTPIKDKTSLDDKEILVSLLITVDNVKDLAMDLYGYMLSESELEDCGKFVYEHEKSECRQIKDAVRAVLGEALQEVIDPERCHWEKVDPRHREEIQKMLIKAKEYFAWLNNCENPTLNNKH